jgi:hypothetical protein
VAAGGRKAPRHEVAEVGQRRCSGRYGDLTAAPTSMVGATLGREEQVMFAQASVEASNKDFCRPSERMNERSMR